MAHKFSPELEIDKKTIGINYPTYFIADIAANHDGDLKKAVDLIYLAAESGADAAKFQHFNADTIISDKGFKALEGGPQSHQKKWKSSVYEVYKAAAINLDWTEALKEACESAGIAFFTSPYSIELVDFIDDYVPAFKIGSGDITWHKLIEHVASKQKPFFLATGASNILDVQVAVERAVAINQKLVLMQCNTNYTGSLDNYKYINLNVLNTYKSMFPNIILGLSDHSPGFSAVMGAIALGARVIEKHFTDNKNLEGPDHQFSLNPKDWSEMVSNSRELEASLGGGIKKIEDNELATIVLQRRALRFLRSMSAGEVITELDLASLRPCPPDAIAPYELKDVIGRCLRVAVEKEGYLKWSDLQ